MGKIYKFIDKYNKNSIYGNELLIVWLKFFLLISICNVILFGLNIKLIDLYIFPINLHMEISYWEKRFWKSNFIWGKF